MAIVPMVAVALTYVAAVPQRAARFRQLATDHAELAYRSQLAAGDPFICTITTVRITEADVVEAYLKQYGDKARRPIRSWAYHHELQRKYSRAARYPWLLVPPDPPEAKSVTNIASANVNGNSLARY